MDVNVNMKKIVIGIVVLLVAGGAVWWFVSTKDERTSKAELETMIKYAQKQALEIVIIEQASKLTDYRKQLSAMKKPNLVAPLNVPIVSSPKDVDDSR